VTAYLHDLGSAQTMQGPNLDLPLLGGIFPNSTIIVAVAVVGSNQVTGPSTVTDNSGNNYKLAASLTRYDATYQVWLGLFYCPNSKLVYGGTNISFRTTIQGSASTVMSAFWAQGIVTSVEPLATIRTANGGAGKPTITSNLSMTSGDLMVGVCAVRPWSANLVYSEDTSSKWASPPFQKLATADALVGIAGPTVINPNGQNGVTWAPNVTATSFWVAILAGFKVAATTVMPSASDLVVGSPEIDMPLQFSIFGKMVPRPLIVQSPFIGIPSTILASPQVVCLTHRDDGIQESLFTNTNVDFSLETVPGSLIGRTSDGRGPAESINVVEPLQLADGELTVDVGSLVSDLDTRVANLEAAVYPLVDQMGGVQQALNNINDQFTAINKMITDLQTAVFGGTNDYMSTYYMYSISSPSIGQPTLTSP
jgi:hypothetical protein